MPRRQTSRWTKQVVDGYDRLGCGAFLCLFTVAVIGLVFVAQRVAFCIAICLQLGRDAYFREGVRGGLGHDHFGQIRLSNGQMLAPYYQGVFHVVWTVALLAWIAGAFFVVTAINNFLERRRDRPLAGKPPVVDRHEA
jgi:hypothetical protein